MKRPTELPEKLGTAGALGKPRVASLGGASGSRFGV